MNAHTTLDLRAHDAQERGNKPEPEAIPYVRDEVLTAAIQPHIDALRTGNEREGI